MAERGMEHRKCAAKNSAGHLRNVTEVDGMRLWRHLSEFRTQPVIGTAPTKRATEVRVIGPIVGLY